MLLAEDIYQSNFKGHKIYDTKHSIDRFFDQNRFKDAGTEDLKKEVLWVINNGIEKILDNYKDENNTYIIHSKSTGLGIVVDWRKDKYNIKDSNNHIFIITILGKRNTPFHKQKSDDVYLVVENQLMDWAVNKIKLEEGYDPSVYQEATYDHTKSIDGFMVAIYEGKYKDVTGEIIIVD